MNMFNYFMIASEEVLYKYMLYKYISALHIGIKGGINAYMH